MPDVLAGDWAVEYHYDSGQHGSGWIDKDVVNEHTDREDGLCTMLAEVVCGPATGGLIVS